MGGGGNRGEGGRAQKGGIDRTLSKPFGNSIHSFVAPSTTVAPHPDQRHRNEGEGFGQEPAQSYNSVLVRSWRFCGGDGAGGVQTIGK